MLSLLRKLRNTATLIHPGSSPRSLYKQTKYCIRGVACAGVTAEWLEILENPALAAVVRHNPNLFQKLQRPYLTSRFHTPQRLQALRQHYQFILAHFPPVLLREIHSPTGKRLAILPIVDTGPCELHLNFSRLDKEGELALALLNPAGRLLCHLTFSIVRFEAGQCEILIGGLQGNKSTNDRDLIVSLTRHWHGLRPKAMLLFAIHQLAAAWSVTRVRAVGDQTHIYRHWRKRKKVASSYDEWWIEAGGQLAADGIFDLPARFIPREIASLKVNKRQMYKRRYQMLSAITDQIGASLGVPSANSIPVMPPEFLPPVSSLETLPVPIAPCLATP